MNIKTTDSPSTSIKKTVLIIMLVILLVLLNLPL